MNQNLCRNSVTLFLVLFLLVIFAFASSSCAACEDPLIAILENLGKGKDFLGLGTH